MAKKKKYTQRFKKPDRKPKWKKTQLISFSSLFKDWRYRKFRDKNGN